MPSQSKFSSGPLPSQTPHSSTTAEPPQSPLQSASAQPSIATDPGPEEANVTPPLDDRTTLLTSNVAPALVAANSNTAREPEPAARLAPDKENPTTTPVVELELTFSKLDEAPVTSTPLAVN